MLVSFLRSELHSARALTFASGQLLTRFREFVPRTHKDGLDDSRLPEPYKHVLRRKTAPSAARPFLTGRPVLGRYHPI